MKRPSDPEVVSGPPVMAIEAPPTDRGAPVSARASTRPATAPVWAPSFGESMATSATTAPSRTKTNVWGPIRGAVRYQRLACVARPRDLLLAGNAALHYVCGGWSEAGCEFK